MPADDDRDDCEWHELESLEDAECEPDCGCIGCLAASFDLDEPPLPDEPEEPHPPIQLEQTRHEKEVLRGQDILPKVLRILDTIAAEGMTLSLFLDAISWGDDNCTANDRVRFMRAGLLQSEELPGVLSRWYWPPRNKNKGRQPAGAHQTLDRFALTCVSQKLEREMECTGAVHLAHVRAFRDTSHIFRLSVLHLHPQGPMSNSMDSA